MTALAFMPSAALLQPSKKCAYPGLQTGGRAFLKPANHTLPKRRALNTMRGHHVKVGVMTDEVRTPLEDISDEKFQWSKQWYPLRVSAYLEPDRPHHAMLLGKDVVLWRDGSGKWNCFGDMCPHRLAPLSEGRVEADGNLLCSYHAWRFNGDGDCVSIPQSKNEEVEKIRCATPRACAEVYPCIEKQGVIWVWGESGPLAQVESTQKGPLLIEELEDPEIADQVEPVKWGIYNLPYGWEHFMENVVDPAHVGVSHHNIMGSRYDIENNILTITKELTTTGGFAAKGSITGAETVFEPPCRVRINGFQKDDYSTTSLVLYAVPSKPGHCTHVGCQLVVRKEKKGFNIGNPFFALIRMTPTWLFHVVGPMFLIQDQILLHRQEVYKRKYAAGLPDTEAYYTPDSTDRLVRRLRDWISNHAGGGVPWPKGMSDYDIKPKSHDELFNVWELHTSMCAVCKAALRNLKILRGVLIAATAVAFLKGAPWLLRNSTAPSGSASVISLGVAAALAGITVLLNKFIGLYYELRFSHADNN